MALDFVLVGWAPGWVLVWLVFDWVSSGGFEGFLLVLLFTGQLVFCCFFALATASVLDSLSGLAAV